MSTLGAVTGLGSVGGSSDGASSGGSDPLSIAGGASDANAGSEALLKNPSDVFCQGDGEDG